MLSFDPPENIKKRGFLMILEGGGGGGDGSLLIQLNLIGIGWKI